MSADIPIVSLLLRIAVLIISVLAVGFFAGAETAFLAMDKWVISSLSTEGDKRARVLQGLKDNSENTLSALLVGTNVFTILVSVSALSIAYTLGFNRPIHVTVVSLLATAVIFIFSELIPKTYTANAPTESALSVSIPLGIAVKALSPVAYLVAVLPGFLVSVFSRGSKSASDEPESEVMAIFEIAEEDGYVTPEDKDVIDSVFSSRSKTVAEIMQPWNKVVAYEPGVTLWQAVDMFDSHRYSRVPVVSAGGDVLGVVYIKDVVREVVSNPENAALPVTHVMRPPHQVMAGENILTVFSKLKRMKVHLAVVVQGKKPVGIVTMEDLLKELVGDIPEEVHVDEAADTLSRYRQSGMPLSGTH
jgi:putative hemolysin